jgi:hypothetical protein
MELAVAWKSESKQLIRTNRCKMRGYNENGSPRNCENLHFIQMHQISDQWRAFVNIVMNLRVPCKWVTSWLTQRLLTSQRTLLHAARISFVPGLLDRVQLWNGIGIPRLPNWDVDRNVIFATVKLDYIQYPKCSNNTNRGKNVNSKTILKEKLRMLWATAFTHHRFSVQHKETVSRWTGMKRQHACQVTEADKSRRCQEILSPIAIRWLENTSILLPFRTT